MSYVQNKEPRAQQAPIDLHETTGAGPLAPGSAPTYSYTPRRVSARSRLQRAGYWVVVVAALALLLVLLGVFVPKLVGGIITGFYVAAFVGLLSLMNLSRFSNVGNRLLGRKVFPAIRGTDSEILRLAGVNTVLTFLFSFVFTVVASFLNVFLGGLVVFGVMIAAAVFYGRVRSVVIKP